MARPERLAEAAVQERLAALPDWKIEDGMLRKTFRFKRFMEGIDFVNQVATMAEEMDHHPDMTIRFGLVTISLTTHSARGLTRLDFDQAERLNSLT
jgi:4a-hydroxytetrahydrobiopterin dehydratase